MNDLSVIIADYFMIDNRFIKNIKKKSPGSYHIKSEKRLNPTETYYWFITSVISLVSAVLLSVPLCRLWEKRSILSACMGIILYRVIRCVFVDCGWEFASFSGVKTGLFMEAAVLCGGLLFSEGIREQADDGRGFILLSALGAILMKSGSDLSLCFSLLTDVRSGIIGAAMRHALLLLALWRSVYDGGKGTLPRGLLFSVVCVFSAGATVMGTRCLARESESVAAPFISMLGVSAVISSLSGRKDFFEGCSPWGFALGIMVSYGFDGMIR